MFFFKKKEVTEKNETLFYEINLSVNGEYKTTLFSLIKPQNESDLLTIKEYDTYYHSVGLGAPVEAVVSVFSYPFRINSNAELKKINRSNAKKKHEYHFAFMIKGNYMTHDMFMNIIDKYEDCSRVEQMHVHEDNSIELIIVFVSGQKAYQLYQELENRSNVGAYEGIIPGTQTHVVRAIYQPIE